MQDHIKKLEELRLKALRYENPETIPVRIGIIPTAWIKYREELNNIVKRYHAVFPHHLNKINYDEVWSETYHAGNHTDAWGCVWENLQEGREAIVKQHPLATRQSVRTLAMPKKNTGFQHGFMYLRLADLRGFEEIMIDFAEEPEELKMLIEVVLKYNLKQRDILLSGIKEKEVITYFGDDLGMQHGLAMGAMKWKKYMKPCFMELYRPIREKGHHVYMHTDGQIFEIIPDLVDCGVDVVNPQFRANGLANLVKVCKGKVCVDLDLDRQMFPFCKPKDIDTHVKEAVQALGSPKGGLWLTAEIDEGVSLENIEAIAAALDKYRFYFSAV